MIPRLFALFLLVVAGHAHAATVTVIFCASYQVAYTNNTAVNEYFTSNANQAARGAKIKVTENGGAVKSNAYSAWSGTAGCTAGLALDTLKTYTVQILGDALVDTNTVQVRNTDGSSIWVSTALTNYQPPTGGEIKPIVTGVHAAWNVAAAAGWAIYHQSGGIVSQTLTFRTGASGNSFQENGGPQYSNIQNDTDKYVVIHEMGHQMSFLGNAKTLGTNTLNYGAAPDGCPALGGGHDLNSKEYQKAAAMEGFASFYAQLAFNDDTLNADCYYHHSGEDWNLNALIDDASDPSCDLGPYAYPGATSPIDEFDYLGDKCLTTGPSNNRATQYDYMRFFWDIHTKGGLGSPPALAQILAVWDASNPQNWNQTGTASNTTAGNPAYELRQAAIGQSLLTFWDSQDDMNGVQR